MQIYFMFSFKKKLNPLKYLPFIMNINEAFISASLFAIKSLKGITEMEEVDLRNLLMTVVEKKDVEANLSLEFDCVAYINDTNMLVKCINYGINYINQLSDQQMQISLNAAMNNIMAAKHFPIQF